MDLDKRIRQRAFRIWVEEGQPSGKHREHWERAKAEVLAASTLESGELNPHDTGAVPGPVQTGAGQRGRSPGPH